MNRLFVAYKPSGVSSNHFLSRLKREYKTKKAGFSGTLDPFAKGVLIIGMGSYTKLFRFLDKTPKRYIATLWLGAKSDSLDIEMIDRVDIVKEIDIKRIEDVIASLKGTLEYEPPIFSAKHIDGQRAYDLARAGKEVKLEKISSTIYDAKLLNYSHPFITFEAVVSEGTYIRSLGKIIANTLGEDFGSLSSLERVNEGEFRYNNNESLDIKKCLKIAQNFYNGDNENLKYGRIIALDDLEIKDEGYYWLDSGDFISVINIENRKVHYELGRVEC